MWPQGTHWFSSRFLTPKRAQGIRDDGLPAAKRTLGNLEAVDLPQRFRVYGRERKM